jgi:type II secretory pathway pseudopilin PulG
VKRPEASERGFTLIELLVYVSFFVVIVAIAGGILINSLGVEKSVRGSTDAATLGQLLTQSISQSVRNATAIDIPLNSDAAAGIAGTELLVLETLSTSGAAEPQCHAWLYVPSHGGQLFSARSATKIPVPSVAYLAEGPGNQPISAPTGWSSFGEGINPITSDAKIFAQSAESPQSVSFDFVLNFGDELTEVSAEASSYRDLRTESPLCF